MMEKSHALPQPSQGGKRQIELDFIRGIAILLVMGTHFSYVATGSPAVDAFTGYLKANGGIGVNLFFTLSGYLVGGLLMTEWQRNGQIDAWRFLVRRAFKIWPPLYALVLFHALLGRHPLSTFFWQNLLHVQNYFGTSITQTWSLAVEEHFYIFLACALSLMSNRPVRTMMWMICSVCLASFLARCYAVHEGWLDQAFRQTQFRMDSLMFGVILVSIQKFHQNAYAWLEKQRWPLLVLSSAAFIAAEVWSRSPELERSIGYAIQGISFCALIIFMRRYSGALSRTWWYRSVAWIGVYSYGTYLWHSVALEPGRKLIAWTQATGMEPHLGLLLALGSQGAIGCLLGYVTTRVVEFPALAIRDRLVPGTAKRTAPRPSPESAAHAPF